MQTISVSFNSLLERARDWLVCDNVIGIGKAAYLGKELSVNLATIHEQDPNSGTRNHYPLYPCEFRVIFIEAVLGDTANTEYRLIGVETPEKLRGL